MAKSPPRPHPPVTLKEALELPRAIAENNAGRPMNRILLAESMKLSPSSSGFRDRVMAAFRYGLTDGNYHSETISLTAVGDSATRPRNEHERIDAERQAFRNVPVFAQLLEHFGNARLPEQNFLKNALERAPFNVDASWSAEVVKIFSENAIHTGLLRVMNNSSYLVIDGSTSVPEPVAQNDSQLSDDDGRSVDEAPPATDEATEPPPDTARRAPESRPVPMQIFVAHGRNKKPLDQLKQILNEWQVPFVVAVDEANAGRPISAKVADLMRSCTAGIFIFTADDEFQDVAGSAVFRPSQNVIYELGAASLLYGQKIVVFKEKGVTFPTDFSDLGWIEFERDALNSKAMDLLRELIALKAIKLVSTVAG